MFNYLNQKLLVKLVKHILLIKVKDITMNQMFKKKTILDNMNLNTI